MLTSRENQVLALIKSGHENKEIAKKLKINPNTISEHISSIKRKTESPSVNAINELSALSFQDWELLAPKLEAPITPAESVVLMYLCRGISSKVTARILGISPRTVEKHREHLLSKTGRKSARQLIFWTHCQYVLHRVSSDE
ncbi:response regulator transcription factor [Pseudomonas putida]|uniref:response regulator transcription factor n=1 Tax=Pseudomonas putida TaxID=303 RepID=UPI003D665831